jgi:hypothetical protein
MLFHGQFSSPRVICQRVGANDRFEHLIGAESAEQACEKAISELTFALGPNAADWEIVHVAEVILTEASQPTSPLK